MVLCLHVRPYRAQPMDSSFVEDFDEIQLRSLQTGAPNTLESRKN